MSICTIIPSRNRPAEAYSAMVEYFRTAIRDDTYLVIAVDDDDPQIDAYRGLFMSQPQPNTFLVEGPRVRMGPTLNREAVKSARVYDIIGFTGDDHRARTRGWDAVISNTLTDSPGVAYGDDLIQHEALPTACWVNSKYITRLGYMVPPGLIHLYLDNFWLDLGRATRLHYLPDIVFEHMHPIAGKAKWDAGYIEANNDETTQHDAAEYRRFIAEDWPKEMERL